MKAAVTITLIASLLYIAVFGLASFGHSMSHGADDCVASILTNVACSPNIASQIEHHFSAIYSFFHIPLKHFSLASILLTAVSVLSLLYLLELLFLHNRFITQRNRDRQPDINIAMRKISSWLSLFELSPSR